MSDQVTNAARTPARVLFGTLFVLLVSGLAVLFSGGLAAAEAVPVVSDYAAAPVSQLLGVPMGTAIWALLGLVTLVAGSLIVSRPRTRLQRDLTTWSAPAESVNH